MVKHVFSMVLFTFLFNLSVASAHLQEQSLVDVQIVSDSGEAFAQFRTYPRVPQEAKFFYLEAVKGQRYSIQITNKSNGRIGVVIAVDGRNIINGKKSDLQQNERMYIIRPHETNTFEGWRTGMDRINRFYFTEQSDAYAEKVFADASAMGTIALAVYREKLPEITSESGNSLRMKEAPAEGPPGASAQSRSEPRGVEKRFRTPGTGFGETAHSPARVVHFNPEPIMAEKIVLKYEWRSELCRKGIIRCAPRNRFWPDDLEFAPLPKDFNG